MFYISSDRRLVCLTIYTLTLLKKYNNRPTQLDKQLSILLIAKKMFVLKCYFVRRAHGLDHTPLMMVLPSGTQSSAESTATMQIDCLAYGHDILTLLTIKTDALY